MYGLEGVLTIFCIVSGSDVKQFVADGWTHYFLIIVTGLDAAQEILQADTQCSTFGKPHRQSLTYGVREHEQVHLLTDFTVVALLGLFENNQVLVEHLLLREADTVDRVICSRLASPRQKAPATLVIFTALIRPVFIK